MEESLYEYQFKGPGIFQYLDPEGKRRSVTSRGVFRVKAPFASQDHRLELLAEIIPGKEVSGGDEEKEVFIPPDAFPETEAMKVDEIAALVKNATDPALLSHLLESEGQGKCRPRAIQTIESRMEELNRAMEV